MISGVSNTVIMAAFRKSVRDSDLIKKLSRKNPATVQGLFDMANHYASQEEAMAAKNN